MYNTVLFDLDGTLTNPAEGITNSVAYALCRYDITVEDKRELYKFIGPPLSDSFSKYYGFSQQEALRAVDIYREYFSVKGLFENEVYPGIPELLSELKADGKRIILATSKPEKFAIEILKHFNLYKYFDYVAGATMDGKIGEKADVMRYAISAAKVSDLKSIVMIGDRCFDIEGAKSVGVDSIGVLYGFGDLKELTDAGATHIAERVEDIIKIIKEQ